MSADLFSGKIGLGSRVETSRKRATRGRVVTVLMNPREGQCYLVSWLRLDPLEGCGSVCR